MPARPRTASCGSRAAVPCVIAAALLFLVLPAAAQRPAAPTEMEYGYPDQSIFVAAVNSKGQPDSPMTRLADALLGRAGIPWHATPYPASRLFINLQNGSTAFSILVRAPSLEACCLFSRQPVYSTSLNVYAIGDKAPVVSKDDLVGKRIITIRGYSYAGLAKFIANPANRIANETAGTHDAAFAMLRAQRADYVIDYASAASDVLAGSPIADLRSQPIDRLDVYLVLSRSYPGAEELMHRFEEIIKTLDVERILREGRGTR